MMKPRAYMCSASLRKEIIEHPANVWLQRQGKSFVRSWAGSLRKRHQTIPDLIAFAQKRNKLQIVETPQSMVCDDQTGQKKAKLPHRVARLISGTSACRYF